MNVRMSHTLLVPRLCFGLLLLIDRYIRLAPDQGFICPWQAGMSLWVGD